MIQTPSESSIVRSLSLELFSNLEDSILKKEKDPSLTSAQIEKIENIKNLVRSFLEKRALENLSCFNAYSLLLKEIEILTENNEQHSQLIRPIIFKSRQLVDTEKNIKHTHYETKWYKIRAALHLGLLKADISYEKDLSKKLNLPLFPKIPKPTQIFNLYAWSDNINLLHSSYREAGIWLMQHVQIFTFKDLCQSLKKSCETLKNDIIDLGEYQIVTIEKKSQSWVAEIGYRFLPTENPPQGVTKLDEHILSSDLLDPLFKSSCKNFIFFDDCAYTGTQFITIISLLYQNLSSNKYVLTSPKKIYFIYGAAAIDLKETLKKYDFNKYNVQIEFITSLRVNNLKSLLEIEQLPEKLSNKIKKLGGGRKNTEGKQTLFTTEWKRPDSISIPAYCSGHIGYYYSRVRTESKKQKKHTPELTFLDPHNATDVFRLTGMSPITDVEKPYK